MKSIVLSLACSFVFGSLAQAGLSPYRAPEMSYEEASFAARLTNVRTLSAQDREQTQIMGVRESAEKSKRFLSQLDASKVNALSSIEQLNEVFRYVRDTKFIKQEDNQARRLTWFYPDDGCYARAGVAAINLRTQYNPTKVFVFGDLKVRTSNSPWGTVEWWYHVAVAFRVGTDVYIIDPAINPEGPLKVEDWGLTMVKDIRQAKFAFCDKGTYDPDSDCRGNNSTSDSYVIQEQKTFLPLEWERVLELGRDPHKDLLGLDFPLNN